MDTKVQAKKQLICYVTFQISRELLQSYPLRNAFLKHICKISVLSYRYTTEDVWNFVNIIYVLTAPIKQHCCIEPLLL